MDVSKSKHEVLRPELYFLLQKFLAASPLQDTYKVLCEEIKNKQLLPTRLDWQGEIHDRPFEDLERMYPHIESDHLLQICSRIGPILEKDIPSYVPGSNSLLGIGRQSLLRTVDNIKPRYTLRYYGARLHGMPMCDPFVINTPHNIAKVIIGREMSGPITRMQAVPSTTYSHIKLQRQTLGHLSAVYCLLFDRTGRYIITGADDLLVKLWSSTTGKLLMSFRGASAEITDIDINLENTLIAAGSMDKILRVWDLQNGAPVAVLLGHTGMITSVHFCPSARWDVRYLVTTSSDGCVAFWTYSLCTREKATFVKKPTMYQEKVRPGQSQMICSAFSPGGSFLAAGSADHHVRVYWMRSDEGPLRILETEVHTDRVDSIVWAHRGVRFVSGSKDGTAFIWHFERQQWKNIKLSMTTKVLNSTTIEEEDPKKLYVTMAAWDYNDVYIVTAVSDNSLKVWNSSNGELQRVLTGHTDGIYVLESHPIDPFIMLSTGHDGQIFIWDVLRGKHVAQFTNNLDNGQGVGAIFDAKWAPDGSMFAASDSHGHMMIFGFGTGNALFQKLPKELFFHTDYRPFVRDADQVVLDEQTQIPPHLMPPPFLVDIDGNPYPPMLQRLVPGREHCTSEQLVPNIVIGNGGRQEVIQGIEQETPRSYINRMIAAVADTDDHQSNNVNPAPISPRLVHNGARRSGDPEGVRQSIGDWNSDPSFVWSKHVLVPPLRKSELAASRQMIQTISELELAEYHKEIKKRPLMINTLTTNAIKEDKFKRRRRNGATPAATRRTRANPTFREDDDLEEEDELEHDDQSNSSSDEDDDSSANNLSLSDSCTESDESSGYSDWVAEKGVNLEPPKRAKRKSAHKKLLVDDDEDDDEALERLAAAAPLISKSKSKSTPFIKKPPKMVNGEVAEVYRNLEWLSETVPRKAPYCPQMGDEVVYFVQGHKLYVDAVKTKKEYNIINRDLPWTKLSLKDHEFVKIVGIKYEIRPPRLCCLKLAFLDDDSQMTDKMFTIKYHDMPDVLDFFVLKQTYEVALSRVWEIGENFRCMIDDGWWIGTVISKSPVSDDYPESHFMCYEIMWGNKETERMSPWDMEPIREDRVPENVGEAVPVLPEEIQAILYQPTPDEWPNCDRESACRIIIAGLEKVMALAIAEPFLAPVDFNVYPSYAFTVEYPIDLSTIKARFENHFYRRITSAQFDVRYLATNAEKFNKPHSVIVKHARIITELCLRIIKNCTHEIDVPAMYHQMMDTYESSCTDDDDDADSVKPGPSRAPPSISSSSSRQIQTRNVKPYIDWRVNAKHLIDELWRHEDSGPFRCPVNRDRHPEYYQIIDHPIDLQTIKEDLLGGNYNTPQDFAKDIRLIFQNSKNFNTNKRSRIYAMTIRLSSIAEERLATIISDWKRARSKGCTVRKSSRRAANVRFLPKTDSEEPEEEDDENDSSENDTAVAHNSVRNSPDNDDDDTSDDEPLVNHRTNNQNRIESTSSESDSDASDSTPLSQIRTKMKKKVENVKVKHEQEDGEEEEAESSNDSDYEPLCKYKKVNNTNKRKLSSSSEEASMTEASSVSSSSSTSSSNSDSGIKKNARPSRVRKRRKYFDESSGDEFLPVANTSTRRRRPTTNSNSEDEDDEDDEQRIVTVSSRGRVVKMTEKASAFLRKT